MWSQFAARRRRERRLRAYLKYARMSVAMALAEARHRTAPRGQMTARAEATNDAPRSQTTNVAGDTGMEFFAMSEDSDVVGGGRPPCLVDVRRQGQVQQRTVEQIVDPVPLVPMLHDVVPLMVEQLVDVPTVLSYSSLQQLIAEQTVDIPVPGRAGGGGCGGLEGFLGQGLTASSGADRVDIPVPRSGGLQGSRPGQGSTASSSHDGAADGAGQGFFRTFPRGEKVRSKVRTRGRN